MSLHYRKTKLIFSTILPVILGFVLANPVNSANFPSKPVSVTNCFPAGGGADRNIQAIKPFLEKYLGVSILLKYETGASNTLALQNLAKKSKNGYDLVICDNGGGILAPISLGLKLGPEDVIPVAQLANIPWILTAHKNSPEKTTAALVKTLKAAKSPVTLPIVNIASSDHYMWIQFLIAAGVPLNNVKWVPFGGGGPKMRAMLAGESRADMLLSFLIKSHVGKGTLIPMAIASDQQHKDFPTMTTLKSQGYPVIDGISLVIYASRKTPKAQMDVLFNTFRKAKNDPEYQKVYKKMGQDLNGLQIGGEFEPYWRQYWKDAVPNLKKAMGK
jgi:tripartite-type tricarboxylate transporter receptor subunit TctC